ncbi:endonuclease domain-containing protein [Candidatus Gracilibacteria bacterium]|nr:endonuclease domain-containing protein [Candidatus Gracilibacteria bacterium]
MKSKITFLAKVLRKKQTPAENLLWQFLKAKSFENLKFRRQFPIDEKYIVDFVCFEKRIIIELDGGQHDEELNIQKDKERDGYLERQGFKILRVWNNDVLSNIDGVGQKILEMCDENPSPRSSPARGEEERRGSTAKFLSPCGREHKRGGIRKNKKKKEGFREAK